MIEVYELVKKLNNNHINIIDIRDSYNYNKGHIPTAINITENKLLLMTNYYLNKNDTYYIYCKNGTRSKQIVNSLRAQGYNAININGGYNNYLLMK